MLPMLYYGTQCWALVLCPSTRLAALDAVAATAAQMAFPLEQRTFVDASLVVGGFASGGWLGAGEIVNHETSCSVLGAEAWGSFERLPSFTGF